MKLKPVSVDGSETIYSAIARLAAINGSGNARALVRHLGIPRMGFDGSAEAFEKLSLYSGMTVETFARASYRRHSNRHVNMGGSLVARKSLSSQTPRFCALCVMEDVDVRHGRSVVRPFERFSWTVTDVVICHKHDVGLDRATGPSSLCHEFVLAVSERLSMVEAKAARAEPLEISPCERYFAARLDGLAQPVPDLDVHPYYVSKALCERLGVLDARGPDANVPTADSELAAARERGFNLIANTAGGLREHLSELTKGFWKPRRSQGFQYVFGNLYRYVARHMDEDHRGLINLLKNVAIENLPVGPSDSFLGTVTTRRWHSVVSFSREHGISPRRAVGILAREGFIRPESGFDQEPYSSIVFDAEMAAPLFPRLELMDRFTLTRRMKLDRFRNTAIFAKEGPLALRRHSDEAGVFRLYSISEAEDLLARMTRSAGEATSSDFCRPHEAAHRALCSIDEVLELLANGELEQVTYQAEYLFEGIMVSTGELRAKTKVPYPGWVHPNEVAERLCIGYDEAAWLMRKETLKSEWVNYRFGTAIVTTNEAVDEFDKRYVSVSAAAKVAGKLPASLVRKLGKSGVPPAINNQGGRPLFYHRYDLVL
ncbi:TniQ family protein [Rhizobium ruizarguesonis]